MASHDFFTSPSLIAICHRRRTVSSDYLAFIMERRTFMAIVGAAGVGILLPYAVYRYMMAGSGVRRVGVKDFLSAGPQAALRAITPAGDLYIMSSRGNPSVDRAKWLLVIDGLVEQPLRFGYDEIRKLAPYETYLTLECISNPIGGLHWQRALARGAACASA